MFQRTEKFERERVILLQNYLTKLGEAYYSNATSPVSDSVYDALHAELKRLERKYPDIDTTNSPTNKVGHKS